MGCGDTFAITGNLVIYSNQYSNSLCLKSCKVCLNGPVRAFHLAALGPHPRCKGQLSNAWTIREIIKLTQLKARLGSLPGLQRLRACSRAESYWLQLQWHWCEDSVGHQGQGEGGEPEEEPVLQSGTSKRYPRPCEQREERSWPAQGPPAWDAPALEHRALGEGFWGLMSCYLTALSLHWW